MADRTEDKPEENGGYENGGYEIGGYYDEEAGTEIAPARPETIPDDESGAGTHEDGAEGIQWNGLGWAGLILSILSLLFLPVFLGAAGIIVGYLAYRRGARGLGLWAMGIGAVSIIGSLFFAPFF